MVSDEEGKVSSVVVVVVVFVCLMLFWPITWGKGRGRLQRDGVR